jgi:hypothetical protein
MGSGSRRRWSAEGIDRREQLAVLMAGVSPPGPPLANATEPSGPLVMDQRSTAVLSRGLAGNTAPQVTQSVGFFAAFEAAVPLVPGPQPAASRGRIELGG